MTAATRTACASSAVSRTTWPAGILPSTPWPWTCPGPSQTFFGGREDLARGVIRCVGDAETRFREDALRMLRARRFAAQLGFALEAGTEAAIGRCAGLCAALSRERVREEAEKTLLSDRPALFGRMLEEGLLAACLAPQRADFSALSGLPSTPEAGGPARSSPAPRCSRRRSACPQGSAAW